jgi:hypothetical protein
MRSSRGISKWYQYALPEMESAQDRKPSWQGAEEQQNLYLLSREELAYEKLRRSLVESLSIHFREL